MIDEGHTIVGYLPTSVAASGGLKLTKIVKQAMLHRCLGMNFDPLSSRSLLGILAKYGTLDMHPALALYTTDVPEGKDVSCTSSSTKTAMPCTGCVVERGRLVENSATPLVWRRFSDVEKKRAEAVDLMKRANAMGGRKGAGPLRYEGKAILLSNSLSIVTPFYAKWHFVGGSLHHLLDAHRLFGFERLHNLPNGVERNLLDASMNALGKADFYSCAVLTAKGEPRLASSLRSSILEKCNAFLTETHHFSPMPDNRLTSQLMEFSCRRKVLVRWKRKIW